MHMVRQSPCSDKCVRQHQVDPVPEQLPAAQITSAAADTCRRPDRCTEGGGSGQRAHQLKSGTYLEQGLATLRLESTSELPEGLYKAWAGQTLAGLGIKWLYQYKAIRLLFAML